MGILDAFKSRILMEYKADVDQAKIAIRDLAGEQKKAAQQSVQGVEDQIKAHEALAGKIAGTAAVVGGIIAAGVAGWKKYQEATTLARATAGADMDALRQASHGLLSNMELMQVAAEGMNGRFKLTSAELETVLGAAVDLEAKGIMPLSEAVSKLGEAVRKGEIDPLKDLGIAYDENLAKTDKRGAALKALAALAQESAGATDAESESIRQSGVAFKNSMDQVETSIGRVVTAFTPLIAAVADLAEQVANLANAASLIPGIKLPGGLTVGSVGKFFGRAALSPLMWNVDAAKGIYSGFSDTSGNGDADWFALMTRQREYVAPNYGESMGLGDAGAYSGPYNAHPGFPGAKLVKKKPRGAGGGGGYDLGAIDLDSSKWQVTIAKAELLDRMIEEMAAGRLPFPADDTSASDALAAGVRGSHGPQRDAAGFALGKGGGAYGMDAKGPSILERMFGPVEQFDVYATAWGTFQSAALSAYDAMVSGSESAGVAVRKALAGAIHGIGQKMFVRGLEETAEGFTNPVHFASAALFFAGAATAGVIANQLAPGSSPGTHASGGAGSGAGASASGVGLGGDVTINRTFIIGDGLGDESARSRANRFGRAQQLTRSYESPPVGVEYN